VARHGTRISSEPMQPTVGWAGRTVAPPLLVAEKLARNPGASSPACPKAQMLARNCKECIGVGRVNNPLPLHDSPQLITAPCRFLSDQTSTRLKWFRVGGAAFEVAPPTPVGRCDYNHRASTPPPSRTRSPPSCTSSRKWHRGIVEGDGLHLLLGDLGGGGSGKVGEVGSGSGKRSSCSTEWTSAHRLDAMARSLVNARPLVARWEMMNERSRTAANNERARHHAQQPIAQQPRTKERERR
jgi:hypothetical protein